jgi:hypothetical protein
MKIFTTCLVVSHRHHQWFQHLRLSRQFSSQKNRLRSQCWQKFSQPTENNQRLPKTVNTRS